MSKDSNVINGTIYCITNTVNGKQYIGQTRRTVESRWKQHLRSYMKGTNYLYAAMRKYGVECFVVTELVSNVTSAQELDFLESKFIAEYNTLNFGYNLTSGGEGGYERSASYRKRISGSGNHMYGKTHTPEARKIISDKAKGRKHSAETAEKIRLKMIGNKNSSTTYLTTYNKQRADKTIYDFYHPLYGVVSTYQSNLANSYGLNTSAVANVVKGKYRSTKGWTLVSSCDTQIRNAVYSFYNNKTAEYINCTCNELALLCNVNSSTIYRVVSGKRKQTRQGWEFIKEVTNG